MRRDLPVERLSDFLQLPLVATLATYRSDRSVLLSPVWHEWEEGGFNVVASRDDVKIRHLRRDPSASLAVYESDPPYRGVELSTRARLVADGYLEAERRMSIRYLGAERGLAYASSIDPHGFVIRLEAGRLRTWDFADEFPT